METRTVDGAAGPAVVGATTEWISIPLVGLAGDEPLPCPLFVETGAGLRVLYRDSRLPFDRDQRARLLEDGVATLCIRGEDRSAYSRRVEARLDQVLADAAIPLEVRADVLYGVATEVAGDLLVAQPDRDDLARAERVFGETSALVLREDRAAAALRHVLRASDDLLHHSLATGLLAIALARRVLVAEPESLIEAGLAGLLHDVGRIEPPCSDDDADHPASGARLVAGLGLSERVVEAVQHHHERLDGSGFPGGLRGQEIPELARIVGLVSTFDRVRSEHHPRVGLFDSLRILAEVYRGCFEERHTGAFVRLFRA
jgi:putative nucleotidyltransferase with HDIG domain